MTPALLEWAKQVLASLRPGKVLEIGSLDVNGGVRDMLNGDHEYTGLDRLDGPGVDVVAEAAAFIETEDWDAILAFDAFEHDAHWWETAAAMERGLRMGGTAIVTVPDISYPRHHDPDYYRWTARAAQEMMAPLTLVSIQGIKELYSYDDERDVVLKHYATIWEKA